MLSSRGSKFLSSGSQLLASGSMQKSGASARPMHVMASKDGSGQKKGRQGTGTSVMWFRNDLRVSDNEALLRAWQTSSAVLPVYCLDPRVFSTTHVFQFPKTGELRAQFILESVADLRKNLQRRGLDLVIRVGHPEEIVPSLAEAVGAHTVFGHKETCSEETTVEGRLKGRLAKVNVPSEVPGKSVRHPQLDLVWGGTLYHIDDLPFSPNQLPDVYTQFRKACETNSRIRPACKMPHQMGPLPDSVEKIGGCGPLPTLADVGLTPREQSPSGVMHFAGGETAALARLQDYFWVKDKVRAYKETRNGMLGADYSTKFSPWLAHGCITPRTIGEELKKYEGERVANQSTYWVLFELLWRDYFRFLSIKYGNSIFHLGGPRNVKGKSWGQDKLLFEAWRDGKTGYPLIDANMKELAQTGFMSNRGRQIVCSFLVRDMGLDWRLGAEWFETCLLDYDPCSNYGNWTYGAGVGNDPREDRYFSIPKQAQTYDADGEYVAHWLPQLRHLPKTARHFPKDAYLRPIVPLRHGQAPRNQPNSGRQPAFRRN
ncbi:cryptochrome [Marchantia polymorpha subsp. ruderalis]|uniref:Cryptochrome DASH n=2 Tax=Marchantia polymorpha TaxID=3197 RepID=A0AAF6AU81_MARPO|nr:hypothetical protein MARPO_0002s0311 [Marchantia polymorpha]BBN00002.1 hypothetical protein Mp_1g25600 [Marchantia polymorpha subsp. ruderalis]|eukprot:PTQ49876.1 hypothetical protein MARPO_0002s0311 [Marchantia polymorpha]